MHTSSRRYQTRLPCRAEAARTARRWVDALLAALPESLVEDVTFLLNEVVTNSVIHSRSDDDILLSVEAMPRQVRVEVCDQGTGRHFEAKEADPATDTSGRGLYLVEHLADRWGVHRAEHTCVWFEIDCP